MVKKIEEFHAYLISEESSSATCKKYGREVEAFFAFLGENQLSRERVLAYKAYLLEHYQASTVNCKIAALNRYFHFLGAEEFCIKPLRIQKTPFRPKERELNKGEYMRLISAAQAGKKEKLALIIQTLGSTGIRVSELQYITVEAVVQGETAIRLKGKTRMILLPKKLRRVLERYIRKKKLRSGPVFITKHGKPLDRSNIWKMLKRLCAAAGVEKSKVFPHNLRKLFAGSFYTKDKDIAKLADLLGHSSINTTRIYLMSSGTEHRRCMDSLGLVV